MVKRRSLEGYLLIFISGILWGLGGYYATKISNLGVSSLMIPWQHLYLFTNSTFLFWIIFGAITNGLLANLLYLRGLSMDVDASKATIITSVEVVVATLVGVLLLNEKVNFVGYFGIAIMLVSIVLMNINFKKRSKEVAENEVIPENT